MAKSHTWTGFTAHGFWLEVESDDPVAWERAANEMDRAHAVLEDAFGVMVDIITVSALGKDKPEVVAAIEAEHAAKPVSKPVSLVADRLRIEPAMPVR